MVKFLKPNKAIIILQGRYAGRKAVIIRSFDEGTRDRPYGHCLVAGIAKYPKKVIRKDSAKKTAKKSRVKAFVKLVNYSHIMPTRYTLDVDLKDVVTLDTLQSRDKKVTAAKEVKARLEDRFKTGKNRWFFTKLRSTGIRNTKEGNSSKDYYHDRLVYRWRTDSRRMENTGGGVYLTENFSLLDIEKRTRQFVPVGNQRWRIGGCEIQSAPYSSQTRN